jgi:hypothetical protein
MASTTNATFDHQKVAGIKSYLRYKSLPELQDIADAIFVASTEEVTITGTAADGGSANGEVTFPKWLYLEVVMDVRAELGDLPPTGRNAMVYGDYRNVVSRT